MDEAHLGTLSGMQYMLVNSCSCRVMLGDFKVVKGSITKTYCIVSFPAAPLHGCLRTETPQPTWRWWSMSFCYVICSCSIMENSGGKWRICSAPAAVEGGPDRESPSASGWAGTHLCWVRSAAHGQGRAHEELPSPVPVLCRRSTKSTSCENPLKALKSTRRNFWNISPTFPKESTAKLKEQRASADHLLAPAAPYIPDIKKISSGPTCSLVIIMVRKELLCWSFWIWTLSLRAGRASSFFKERVIPLQKRCLMSGPSTPWPGQCGIGGSHFQEDLHPSCLGWKEMLTTHSTMLCALGSSPRHLQGTVSYCLSLRSQTGYLWSTSSLSNMELSP